MATQENLWQDFSATEGIDRNDTLLPPTDFSMGTQTASVMMQDKVDLVKETVSKLANKSEDLSTTESAWLELVQLIVDESKPEMFKLFTQLLNSIDSLENNKTLTGVALIHYIIVCDRPNYIELILQKFPNLDLNQRDDIMDYTPLMWCFSLDRQSCCTELFNYSDKLQLQLKNNDQLTAWDLVIPFSSMYNFLDQNGILKYNNNHNSIIHDSNNNKNTLKIDNLNLNDEKIDSNDNNGMFQIDNSYEYNDLEHFDFNKLQKYQYLEFSDYDIPQILDYLINLPKLYPNLTTYPAALLYQCVRYADYKLKSKTSVESLLFLAFTKISASISSVNNNESMNETSASHSTEGETNTKHSRFAKHNTTNDKPKQTVDIVTQSFWISSLTYLYYYLTKDESFFKRHPNLLQELINVLHSIIIELVTSIQSRLEPLIEKTLLNYTTIEDVKQTLYKKDWNFFKKRKQAKLQKLKEKKSQKQQSNKRHKEKKSLDHHNDNHETNNEENTNEDTNNNNRSDDDDDEINDAAADEHNESDDQSTIDNTTLDIEILRHLFPPSLEEQMKPSPLKIIQIFGALAYVLNLHQIYPLLQQQCFSIAINWFATNVFNQIFKTNKKKKTLSRAHAIQIRLNLSTLESWIRNNDIFVDKPKLIDDFMWERFPFTLIQDLDQIDLNNPTLHSIATYHKIDTDNNDNTIITDESNSLFYYQSFHEIASIHLSPLFQLLQWLQVATTLDSEEALENTLALLPSLTTTQLLKAIDKYNYEVNEKKFNTKLKKHLSTLSKSSGVKNAYMEEKQIPLLCLPTVTELTDAYSNDRETLPFLPDDIQDAIFEIHDANSRLRMNDIRYEDASHDEDDDNDDESVTAHDNDRHDDDTNNNDDEDATDTNHILNFSEDSTTENYKNDVNIFDDINAPVSAVSQPSWSNAKKSEFETNPW